MTDLKLLVQFLINSRLPYYECYSDDTTYIVMGDSSAAKFTADNFRRLHYNVIKMTGDPELVEESDDWECVHQLTFNKDGKLISSFIW